MKVPVSWLREYVETAATPYEMARRLSISSLEVERVLDAGVPDTPGNVAHFRVGRVVSAVPHPNADRLQLCHVDVGNPDPRQIVCGAWNFGAGATVAVGLPGALLPGFPGPLEERPLRGEMSRGMILAEDEIGLGADHAGIMLLPDGLEPGTPLADVLPLVDHVLDVLPTMNRPDLLSMVGIAREVAGLLDGELRPPDPVDPPVVGSEAIDVVVEDLRGCPRYIARGFSGVAVGPSPQWLRSRLHLAGMRSISNVVDITNYVMHVWGSPLHAFDRSLLSGGRIVVRRAHEGETLRTLDGTLRRLLPSDLLITDGERPVALAAIMGGLESEVSETTTELLLEAANFEPIGVLKTSERLGLRTEGSNKWEKGVDPYAAEPAAVLASRLLADLTGATLTGSVDVNDGLPGRPVVTLRPERASELIGLDVRPDEQRSLLTGFGFDVDEGWRVTVPTFRARDVRREVDLAEEVARAVLDRVPHTMPLRRSVAGHLTPAQRFRRQLEDVLTGAGFSEAYTWSLVAADPDPGARRLPAPMSGEQAVLRTTLLHGLVDAARLNVDAGNASIRLFELAHVYRPAGEALPAEPWLVAGIAEGGFEAARVAVEAIYTAAHLSLDVRRTTHDGLHPGKAAATDAGWFGELHPALLEGAWGVFELDVDALASGLPERILYEDVVTYPANRQDIAVTVADEVEAGAIVAAAHEAGGAELREARVFDVYRGDQVGPERKSVALHLVFQAPDRTLTDEEAEVARTRIVDALRERFGAELRA
ncbi:MAG TPA: phenylalanine--tRNA ligase subunit beta [Gaiella sp.]|nr:phenylalanine--tRNA ligase subunit beta [Gaiella sp.]